jgi:hypothetical protein
MNIDSFLLNSGFVKNGTPIDIIINPKFLWAGFGVVVILFAVISFMLIYHWIAYGYKPVTTGMMAAIYLSMSFVMFSVMLITIITYSTTI